MSSQIESTVNSCPESIGDSFCFTQSIIDSTTEISADFIHLRLKVLVHAGC